MLKRLLATAVALGLLACGAVVVLEAVGVLFQPVATDPEQHADAFLARLEADLNTPDLPTEPVEIASQAPPQRPGQEADPMAAVEATEGRHMMAYVLQDPPPRREPEPQQREPEAERLPVVAANEVQDHLIEAARQSGGHRSSLKGAAPEPRRDAGESAAPVRVAATMPSAGRLGGDCTGTCAAKPIVVRPAPRLAQRPAKPSQARYARTGTAQGRAFGCPVLDWLDSVL
ncbi:MAG TPA: hypothetical protein VG758_24490 [Hyphomicrobiaceae bacterium]|nr:hypothetical protein [Hyphomicrobiaceae bacterium]